MKTSRNMAYYPADFVDRIRLIKQLQEERFMPLKVIKGMLDEDPDRAMALVELEDRILERALAGEEKRTSAAEVKRRYEMPQEVLARLEELGILSPNSRGYSPSDVRVVEAISRFRAGGYDERIGFTVYDTLRYKRVLQDLVKEEVSVLMERLAGEMDTDSAVELIEAGSAPLQDLQAADRRAAGAAGGTRLGSARRGVVGGQRRQLLAGPDVSRGGLRLEPQEVDDHLSDPRAELRAGVACDLRQRALERQRLTV
jgi:DNA-binding transcriptional MerR regulator